MRWWFIKCIPLWKFVRRVCGKRASELIQANGGANAGLDFLILPSGLLYLEDGDFAGEAFVSVILDHYPVVNVALGKAQYVVGEG